MLKVISILSLLILVHITTVSGMGPAVPTTCPGGLAAPALACPAGGRCEGECVTGAAATGAPLVCAVPTAGTACTDGVCVDEVCVTVSSEPAFCTAGPCTTTAPYCVNGFCVAHTPPANPAMCRGCATATPTSATQICFKGCLRNMPNKNAANGPCGTGLAACGAATNQCNQICSSVTAMCVNPANAAMPACVLGQTCTGKCATKPVAVAAPSPCPPGEEMLTNMCVTKSNPSMCTTPAACMGNEECIFGTCVAKGAGCAACTGPNDACITGCVPVQPSACNALTTPCNKATEICIPACTGGVVTPPGPPPPPPRVRCQDPATNLTTPAATACEDTGDMTECMRLFPAPPTPAAPPTGTPPGATPPAQVRAPQCDNELLKEAAKRCAKTCKICCELPAYSCKDETIPAGAPTCAQNKASGFCTQDGLKPLMQKLCPATCGLCNTTGTAACSDKQDGCFALQALCLNTQSNAFMKLNCAKTCDTMYPNQGFCPAAGTPGAPGTAPTANTGSNCDVNSQLCNNPLYRDLMTMYCCATCGRCGQTVGGTAGSNNPNCQDQSSACVNWNARGFCRSTFYPDTMKRQQCSRTCGYCT